MVFFTKFLILFIGISFWGCTLVDSSMAKEIEPEDFTDPSNPFTDLAIYKGKKRCSIKNDIRSTNPDELDLLASIINGECQLLHGNIILRHISAGSNVSLGFLNSIEEISGYLAIHSVTLPKIFMPNLKIIHGLQLVEHNSLLVITSYKESQNQRTTYYGLMDLHLPKLQAILRGNVKIADSPNLCYLPRKISWNSLFESPTQKIIHIDQLKWHGYALECDQMIKNSLNLQQDNSKENTTPTSSTAMVLESQIHDSKNKTANKVGEKLDNFKPPCNKNCPSYNGDSYCWGPLKEDCQKITKCFSFNCYGSNRCFTSSGEETCCHPQCSGGCSGPTAKDCFACKHYSFKGECLPRCTPEKYYDSHNNKWVKNNQSHVVFGRSCLLKCPDGYRLDKGMCLEHCNTPGTVNINGVCTYCKDKKCRKECKVECSDYLLRDCLEKLTNCTVINGALKIMDLSFKGSNEKGKNIESNAIDVDLLKKALGKVETINGQLSVISLTEYELESMSFLGNLKVLQSAAETSLALVRTSLKYLGLPNLQVIHPGKVILFQNENLCYTSTIKFDLIKDSNDTVVKQILIDKETCKYTCSPKCDEAYGCSGPGDLYCRRCANWTVRIQGSYDFPKECVETCEESSHGAFTPKNGSLEHRNKLCGRCHSECDHQQKACTGTGSDECQGSCKHAKLGRYCVPKCPRGYFLRSDKVCQPCHPNCTLPSEANEWKGVSACSGAESYVSLVKSNNTGCNYCQQIDLNVAENENNSTAVASGFRCLDQQKACDDSSFLVSVPLGHDSILNVRRMSADVKRTLESLSGHRIASLNRWLSTHTNMDLAFAHMCMSCHPQCRGKCSGPTDADCLACANVRFQGRCIHSCPNSTYTSILNGSIFNDHICNPCSSMCSGSCNGPEATHCLKCKYHKMYWDHSFQTWICLEKCPYYAPFVHKLSDSDELACSQEESQLSIPDFIKVPYLPMPILRKHLIQLAVGAGLLFLILIVSLIIWCHCLRNERKQKAARLERRRILQELYPMLRKRQTLTKTNGYLKCCCSSKRCSNKPVSESDLTEEEEKLFLQHSLALHYQSESKLLSSSYNMAPNMANLLIITDSQLTKGPLIGSGAFGSVYRGLWSPNCRRDSTLSNNTLSTEDYESSNNYMFDVKVPVAIKILSNQSDPNMNQSLLEEAKVMATVDHPCCLRFLALCLTARPQLITPFMPLGSVLENLLNYRLAVDRVNTSFGAKTPINRSELFNLPAIDAQMLITWAGQIADGMSYLGKRGIIHRDLAARNVLVESCDQIRITDFGLAKCLSDSELHYRAVGDKMPIKWLAIESIRDRVYSSKSDVWAYGVTLWEMCTFGKRPFDGIRPNNLLSYIQNGNRLPKPHAASDHIYEIMMKCWLEDSDLRPTFDELYKSCLLIREKASNYISMPMVSGLNSMKSCSPLMLSNNSLRSDATSRETSLTSLYSEAQSQKLWKMSNYSRCYSDISHVDHKNNDYSATAYVNDNNYDTLKCVHSFYTNENIRKCLSMDNYGKLIRGDRKQFMENPLKLTTTQEVEEEETTDTNPNGGTFQAENLNYLEQNQGDENSSSLKTNHYM